MLTETLDANDTGLPHIRKARNLLYLLCSGDTHTLCEVRHAASEERLVRIARNVLERTRAVALRVTHLAQHTAVGARNALDGEHRTVGVHAEVKRGDALLVHVLRRYLARRRQLGNQLVGGHESTLAVADRDGVDIIHRALGQPRREV